MPGQDGALAAAMCVYTWYLEPGDVVVSQEPFDSSFIGYVADVHAELGRPFVAPPQVISHTELQSDYLGSCELSDALIALGVKIGRVDAIYSSRGLALLAENLGLSGEWGFLRERGMELLNRKSHFRQLASSLGTPLAAGMIVKTDDELRAAVEEVMRRTGSAIVKADNGGGGSGNTVISSGDSFQCLGAKSHLNINALRAESEAWARLLRGNEVLVVEEYLSSTHQFYIEFEVGASGPEFVSTGSILTSPHRERPGYYVWDGLQIPAVIGEGARRESRRMAGDLANRAWELGYIGRINVDFILREDNSLIVNEWNARWGGGTVMEAVARRFLGDGYQGRSVARSVKNVRCDANNMFAIAEKFGPGRCRSTWLVLLCPPAGNQGAEFLVVADSVSEADELQERLFRSLEV